MAEDFKTPTEVADEYLLELKSLKPELNTDQTDNDWYIRSRVTGGVVAGLYSDQRLISNDAFPQKARRDAVLKWLDLLFDDTLLPATQSNGIIKITGTPASVLPVGAQFSYAPNGNTYQTTEEATLSAATGTVAATSISSGQGQNLLAGAALTLSSPPAGIDANAEVFESFSDARDEETIQEARERILNRLRSPGSGGTENDYKTWATEADPSVVDASVIRYINGLGTVGIVITAGTADIDTAIDEGQDIVLTPSDALIEAVYEYIDALNPINDCIQVLGAQEVEIDVTIYVKFTDGDSSTEIDIDGTTFTQAEIVQREVKRAIYKTPLGGRKFGTSATGSVIASEIEENVDLKLSSLPYAEGEIAQILADRQVADLSATGINRRIAPTQVAVPGTISVVEF